MTLLFFAVAGVLFMAYGYERMWVEEHREQVSFDEHTDQALQIGTGDQT